MTDLEVWGMQELQLQLGVLTGSLTRFYSCSRIIDYSTSASGGPREAQDPLAFIPSSLLRVALD